MSEAEWRLLAKLNRAVVSQQPLPTLLAILATDLRPLLGEGRAHLFLRDEGWHWAWSSANDRLDVSALFTTITPELTTETVTGQDTTAGHHYLAVPLVGQTALIGCWLLVYPATAVLTPIQQIWQALLAGQLNAALLLQQKGIQQESWQQLDLPYGLPEPLQPALTPIDTEIVPGSLWPSSDTLDQGQRDETAVQPSSLYAAMQRRLQYLAALVNMAKQITADLQLDSVMNTTVQILQQLFNARACTIALLTPDGEELIVEAAAGINPEWLHKARMRLGEGVSGRAVLEQRLIYVANTQTEPNFLFFDPSLRSLLAVPLIHRDQPLGALTLDSDQPEAFDDGVMQLMMVAAAQVSTAIANARLYAESEERAAKLSLAYEELKESERLKDEMVQNVSHELRTPLTFIKGYADLLLDGTIGTTTAEQQEVLQVISSNAGDVIRLISDIMALQRIDSSNLILESFSLRHLLLDAIAHHSLTANRHDLRLVYEGPETPAIIFADRGRINQVLNNLIVNAIKFSPHGGVIRLQLVEGEEVIQFSVIDQGVGIPVDKLELIFERFFQVDGSARRQFGGVGLGLAIVKRIVDAHHGRVWVESKLEQGSAFHVALPVTQPDSDRPA
jgi:signal transduction histidine kinase